MTIEKATIMHISTYNTTTNIKSWCQKVLDLLDLTFAELFCDFVELHGIRFTHFLTLDASPLFLQMREEIIEQFDNW